MNTFIINLQKMEIENQKEFEEEEEDDEPNKDHSLPSTVRMQILTYDDDDDNESTESNSSISNLDSSSKTMKSVTASFNTLNYGTLPSSQKLEKVFQRLICQLDFLKRTANMMIDRMDLLQGEIDELKVQNDIE